LFFLLWPPMRYQNWYGTESFHSWSEKYTFAGRGFLRNGRCCSLTVDLSFPVAVLRANGVHRRPSVCHWQDHAAAVAARSSHEGAPRSYFSAAGGAIQPSATKRACAAARFSAPWSFWSSAGSVRQASETVFWVSPRPEYALLNAVQGGALLQLGDERRAQLAQVAGAHDCPARLSRTLISSATSAAWAGASGRMVPSLCSAPDSCRAACAHAVACL
jgi:hypothetical protein